MNLNQAALKMWTVAEKNKKDKWMPEGGPDAFKKLAVGEATAVMRQMMPPPPGMAPGAQKPDRLDARWAHSTWRAATKAAVAAATHAAAASDWRPADGPAAPEPDVALAAAARADATAAVAAIVDYVAERFQNVIVRNPEWLAAQVRLGIITPSLDHPEAFDRLNYRIVRYHGG